MKIIKPFFFFVLAICLLSCATKKPLQSVNQPNFQIVIDSILQQNQDAVGIMVHVEAPKQNISWSGAAGISEKGKTTLLQPDQPALIASNTKTYVSATILRLVEHNKLSLRQPIGELLSEKTAQLLQQSGYSPDKITVAHLLSHTSGMFDYTSLDSFFEKLKQEPTYRWTRDEQIALAMTGQPLGKSGDLFSYADVNFLLLTEIMEQITNQPFYTTIREQLNFRKHRLTATWFPTLETEPAGLRPRIHQYSGQLDTDSYKLDISFDLFGGGGIAATTKDLARFSQLLFENKLFKKPETLNLIYTEMPTKDGKESNYRMGLYDTETNDKKAYGHGGFWGTMVMYIPELNASIAVFILERDRRDLRPIVIEEIVGKLMEVK